MANPWDDDEISEAPKGASSGPWADDVMQTPEDPRYSGVLGSITKLSDNVLRMVAEGATMGGNKAIAAGTEMLTGGQNTTMDSQRAITAQTQQDLGPVASTAAQMAGGLMTAPLLPGAAVSTGARAIGTGMAMGGVQSGVQSYFDTGELPSIPQVLPGVILGAAGGALGATLGKVLQKPVLNPAASKAAQVFEQNGINVTEGQLSKNAGQLAKEASSPKVLELMNQQTIDFSKAAARKAGIIADDATGAVSDKTIIDAFEKVGTDMDTLVAGTDLQFKVTNGKVKVLDDLRDIANTYMNSVEGGAAKIVPNTVKEVAKAVSKGVMSGDEFQRITSSLEKAAQANKNLAPVVRDMRRTINHAMEDWLIASGNQNAGAWGAANRQYSNYLVIENALAQKTDEAAENLITPKMLRTATQAVKGKRQYARGMTDFDELADAGIAYLKPLPTGNNGNAHELARSVTEAVRKMQWSMGAGAGGGAYMMGLDPMHIAGAAAMGLGAPLAVDAAMAVPGILRASGPTLENAARLGVAGGAGAGNPFTKLISGE